MSFRDRFLRRVGLVPASEVTALKAKLSDIRQKISSGVDLKWGKFGYESNEEFVGSKKWKTLDRMENDPHVSGSLRVNTMPIIRSTPEIIAASDKPKDKEVAEFVSANLLRTNSDRFGSEYWVETSFTQRVREQLDMLKSGFSMFGFSTKRVGTKVVYDRIKWLEPSSVDPRGWTLDEDDNLIEVLRTYVTPTGEYRTRDALPLETIALYVWDLKGVRLEGRPMIRSMYGAWYRKDFDQRMAAIWAQKISAPPPVGLYPRGYDDTQIEMVTDFTQSLRGEAPAEAFFVSEYDGENKPIFDYVGSGISVERGLTGLIASENAEIAHAGGTKSDLLGETESGSRALGDTQQSRELELVLGISEVLAECESHGVNNIPGLIERTVDWNYSGVTEKPVLVFNDIVEETKPTTDEIVKAWTAKIIPHHPDARRQLVERYGLNLPDDAYEIEEPPVPPPFGLPGQAPGPPAEIETEGGIGGKPPKEEDEEEDEAAATARLASIEEFSKRVAPLLAPVKEGTPPLGGRFPDKVRRAAARFAANRPSYQDR